MRRSAVPKQRVQDTIDNFGLLTKEMAEKSVGQVRQCYEKIRELQI